MACTVVASSTAHHYRIITTYIADPARDAVLMRTRFHGPSAIRSTCGSTRWPAGPAAAGPERGAQQRAARRFHGDLVPVAPTPTPSPTPTNRDYAVPTFEALQSSRGFSARASATRARASDGLPMLDTAHSLTPYDSAPNGHVTLTAAAAPAPRPQHRPGARLRRRPDAGAARRRAPRCGSASSAAWRATSAQWQRYDRGLRRPVAAAGLRRGPPVLRVGQRGQGQRGQEVPRRDRRRSRLAVGPGGRRPALHQRSADVLRLLPRGVRARPVRGVRRPARRRRHPDRPGRHAVPVRAPAAARRLDAAQLAGERQARAGHRRPPARRDLVSDPDGLAVGPGG